MAHVMQIKEVCVKIVKNGGPDDIRHLRNIIQEEKTRGLLQNLQHDLLATLYLVLKNEAQNKTKLKEDDKLIVIDLLNDILSQTKLNHKIVFFNFFGFLLQEIYNSGTHTIKNIREEHKLAIMSCFKSLLNSMTSELTITLYTKENGQKMCKMIYVAVEIAIHEKLRILRITAIECLMAVYKVHSDSDYNDLLFRSLVADTFSYFLPGVASCLRGIALGDEKVGYKLIKISIRAMGRIMSLLMEDYKVNDDNMTSLEQAKSIVFYHLNQHYTNQNEIKLNAETSKNRLEEYMEEARNPQWFKKCDEHLARLFAGYRKLTQHPITEVRKELAEMCNLFMEKCSRTMPISFQYLVEILIISSEDQEPEVSEICINGLGKLTELLSYQQNTNLMNKIRNSFYNTFSEMPSVFNGIDDREKVAILKLTAGYVNLFGQSLQLQDCFKQFIRILLHVCEFEVDVSTSNECIIQDLESADFISEDLWKNFKYLKDDFVRRNLSCLCHSLVKNGLFESLSDFLIGIYTNDEEKKESIYLLNEFISGLKEATYEDKPELIKPIFYLYIDQDNWNLPLTVTWNKFEENLSLKTVQSNIHQASLSVEGIGIMADVLQEEFRPFLLQSLFLVLARAGSKQPIVQAAGKKALMLISKAFDYTNATSLMNDNMDYFVFYIERCLKNNVVYGDAFDVMELVLTSGNKDTLDNLLSIVEEVLVQSCDKFKQNSIDSYLRIFKVFLKNLLRWFNVSCLSSVFKTRAQKKQEELQNFKINGLDDTQEIRSFSDDIMGKSAEELYKEDMERKRDDVENENFKSDDQEYKKPEPPHQIRLTVSILKRSLNFLPSKEKDRQLLVLEILKDGMEIIKDYEDDMLPIVHLIWSPLVARFKYINAPVIINYSFQLLISMARISKCFIRSRTVKDVLPNILEILMKLANESYMKDRGSAYRYTQSYKLQTIMLEKLACLAADTDLMEKDVEKIMDVVFIYLSNKQPIPLQAAAVKFFKLIIHYDPNVRGKVDELSAQEKHPDNMKNINKILEEFDDQYLPFK